MNDKCDAMITGLAVIHKLEEESKNKDTVDFVGDIIEHVGDDNLIRCPYCGEMYYRENYRTCTAMYFPPIYKDGVNVNPDRNTTTVHCTCINCGKEFSYKE